MILIYNLKQWTYTTLYINCREEEGRLRIKALQKELLDIHKQKTEECEVITYSFTYKHLIN